ncbi:MAG: hypothetical protein IJ192_05210 [Clostridia bacterium]|nr:hypothetical protein [Clostridia bacterium]MBR2175825.1 hypothetical protein [Clostridia bacterium]
MAYATDESAVIRENLTDAGFSPESIESVMRMLDEQNETALKRLIAEQRKKLLSNIHLYTSQLDCLDYFTYTINKRR